jgi:hypothetical protein
MAARDVAMLVAHRELPSTFSAPRLQHQAAFARRHARQKAVFAAPRNTLGIPGLAHERSILLKAGSQHMILLPVVLAHKERRACSTPHRKTPQGTPAARGRGDVWRIIRS